MTTYKETLFFIGKCLTINHEEHNKAIIEEQLKSNVVNWDNVVRVATAQYVFPALYCNLKRADFLRYLPDDLVEYMKCITDLNRERNQEIIEQAKEVNEILLANNITPIFLKGTAYLLQGLYEDIAERMVGDIDFLVKHKETLITHKILVKKGYDKIGNDLFEDHRHLQRLVHEKRIGALEIHKEMVEEKISSFFNYNTVSGNIQQEGGAFFLSDQHQIQLSSLAYQFNDKGFTLKNISLKTGYDVYLNFLKVNKEIEINPNLFKYVNSFLAISAKVFNTKRIHFSECENTKEYVNIFTEQLNNTIKNRIKRRAKQSFIWFTFRGKILFKALFNKSYRTFVFERFTSKEWREEKYQQLFSKSNS